MFSFMKKGGNSVEKDEKEKRKKEKKELKEHKKRERGNMTAEELLRLDEVCIIHIFQVFPFQKINLLFIITYN